jgi:hypothetical protein
VPLRCGDNHALALGPSPRLPPYQLFCGRLLRRPRRYIVNQQPPVKRLAEFSMRDGGVIVVEVDAADSGTSTVLSVAPGETVEKARDTFEAALAKIRPAAEAIINRLRDLSERPDTVGVEFGLKLSASAGAVIASAATEANFKITLTWKRNPTEG